jgi:hypothetical protein
LNEDKLNQDEIRQRIKRWLEKQNTNQSSKKTLIYYQYKYFIFVNLYICILWHQSRMEPGKKCLLALLALIHYPDL